MVTAAQTLPRLAGLVSLQTRAPPNTSLTESMSLHVTMPTGRANSLVMMLKETMACCEL